MCGRAGGTFKQQGLLLLLANPVGQMSATTISYLQPQAFDSAMRILKAAVVSNASDIHFKASVAPMVRIDGEMCPLEHSALER